MAFLSVKRWFFPLAWSPTFSAAGQLLLCGFQSLQCLLFELALGLFKPLQSDLRASQFVRQHSTSLLLASRFFFIHFMRMPEHFIDLLPPVLLLLSQLSVARRLV